MLHHESVDSDIFHAYDVRGIYPEEINEIKTRVIAVAFARYIRQEAGVSRPRIFVSRDARLSSPLLAAAFIEGLMAEGASIIDAGMTTTPMHYFGVATTHADGGAMITASHNPPLYNGIKFSGRDAVGIGMGSGLEVIARIAAALPSVPPADGIETERTLIDVAESYIDYIFRMLRLDDAQHFSGMRVAVDAGNGMTGIILPRVLERAGIEYYPLYFDPDGAMPNHEANPMKEETLADLKEVIAERNATLGVAFDGDGDRVGFVTSTCRPVQGDVVTALIAQRLLAVHPGASVVYPVTASRLIPEAIIRAGGVPVLTRRGHSFVSAAMRQTNAIFGGEPSGHYFFRDFFCRESAVLAMLELLLMLEESGRTLDALVEPFYALAFSGEINFPIGAQRKEDIMARVRAAFADGNINDLDGLRVDYDDWWFNLRPSNTEPLMRLVIEAPDERQLAEKRATLTRLIQP